MQTLIIDSKVLNNALKRLAPVFASRSNLPLLSNVLLDVREGVLSITATDLKLTIIYHAPFEGEEVRWLLPHKELLNITGIVSAPLTITVDEERNCTIQSERPKWSLGKLDDPALFAASTSFEPEHSIEVDGAFFWSLKQATKSVATSDTVYNVGAFDCVLLDFFPSELRIVSMDKNIFYCHKIKTEANFKTQALFLPDFVRAVSSFENATLEISDRWIGAKSESLTVITRLSENKFPDYGFLLPGERKANCKLHPSDMHRAIDEILVYGGEAPAANLLFTPDGISVDSLDSGSGRDGKTFIPAEHSINGTHSVLAKKLKDLLGQVPENTETLQMVFPDEKSHLIWFKPEAEDDITLAIGVIAK